MYRSYLKGTGFQVLPAGTTREAEEFWTDPARRHHLDIVLRVRRHLGIRGQAEAEPAPAKFRS